MSRKDYRTAYELGSATRLFADPDFDGEPALITEEEMNDAGEPVGRGARIRTADLLRPR